MFSLQILFMMLEVDKNDQHLVYKMAFIREARSTVIIWSKKHPLVHRKIIFNGLENKDLNRFFDVAA